MAERFSRSLDTFGTADRLEVDGVSVRDGYEPKDTFLELL